jgi:ubiquinone/menaquinone biosynthesis C-methylase UbiE
MEGDIQQFEKSWKERQEANYIHWIRGDPINQIQYAFRQHFITFEAIYQKFQEVPTQKKRKFIELGAGRGSLSAYYSDNGDDVIVSDFSQTALTLAQKIFTDHNLDAKFDFVDCENTPYDENSFDICASIGLLEHFQDPKKAIAEQYRILDYGGFCFAYIVPEKFSAINQSHAWLNGLVQYYENKAKKIQKEEVFRTNYDLNYYNDVFSEIGFEIVLSSGIYSAPMISASPEFPFTLLSQPVEEMLVEYFQTQSDQMKCEFPWLCDESYGNAILIVGRK